MDNYFSTLVGRHLGTENIIRPRLPGRFELDQGTSALEPCDEHLNSTIPVVGALQVSAQEENILTPEINNSLNNQEAPLDTPTLTAGLTTRHYEIGPINDVAHSDSPSNRHAINHENKNELLHRIRSMQRFVGNSKSPKNEAAMNVADDLLDSVDSVPVSTQTNNKKNKIITAGEENNSTSDNPAQPPLWMSELTARLNTGNREKEVKTDPVINVTIGRVEVRAVQTDSPKKVRQAKKPTGIMPLDEYLKKRGGKT